MKSPEQVNVTDLAGNIIDVVSRDAAEGDNYITENVLVFVFNSLGKLWTHKRPEDKRHYPGLWDISACGGVISGETPLEAARREQGEEMGFTSDVEHVSTFLNTFPTEDGTPRRRLSHVFLGISDLEPVVNPDAAAFAGIPHHEVHQTVEDNSAAYVPSFLAEYEQVYNHYLQASKRT